LNASSTQWTFLEPKPLQNLPILAQMGCLNFIVSKFPENALVVFGGTTYQNELSKKVFRIEIDSKTMSYSAVESG
jgi:hypothetical protein